MKVMSLLFAFPFSWFFFSVVLPHKSLLPLVILPLLSFFMLFETLLPLIILSLLFFLLLLLSLFSSSKLRKDGGTSPSTLQCLSLPLPFPFRSSFLLVLSSLFVVFSPHACWKVSINLFELLPAASFTRVSVFSQVSLCCRVYLTTPCLPFIPASLSNLPTAHNRCDEPFDRHFSI